MKRKSSEINIIDEVVDSKCNSLETSRGVVTVADIEKMYNRNGRTIVLVKTGCCYDESRAFLSTEKEELLSFLRSEVKKVCEAFDGTKPEVMDECDEFDLYEYIDDFNQSTQTGKEIVILGE